MSERNEQGLLYNDNAHRDAWSGLDYLGVWNFKITEDMVGKTFGTAIDALLTAEGVPNKDCAAPKMSLEDLGYPANQSAQFREKSANQKPITVQIQPGKF